MITNFCVLPTDPFVRGTGECFQPDADKLDLGGLRPEEVEIHSQGWGVDICYGDGDRISLRGVGEGREATHDTLTVDDLVYG